MFSELPKLFDRDFAVGFFLPAAVLFAAVWAILNAFNLLVDAPSLEALTATAIAAVIVWLLAVTLLALNYPILRTLEGYPTPLPRWHPLKSREPVWKRRFRRTIEPILDLRQRVDTGSEKPTPDYSKRLRLAVEDYPYDVELVLPTKFGNVFRALEVYSYIVYGIDAIPAWPRLQAVMPKEFRQQLAESKSILDFFVNLCAASALTVTVYIALAFWRRQLPSFWLPLAAITVSIVSYHSSVVAVRQYGTRVKSAFDLYRGELARQLGLVLPRRADDERAMWVLVNAVTIFRSQRHVDQLDRFRASSPSESTGG
jgi:hypothetical protein